jgi:hypothetical protein
VDPKKFESYLQKNAYYGVDSNIRSVDIHDFINPNEWGSIGEGHFAHVYKHKALPWVMKEGRWDLDIKFFEKLNIKVPRETTNALLSLFKVNFLPNKEHAVEQYKHYLKLIAFLGYFTESTDYYHLKIDSIRSRQEKIRAHLSEYSLEIKKEFNFDINRYSEIINSSDILYHNFLPKEYLLYGEGIHETSKGRETYYIFQEFIEGTPLHDVSIHKLNSKQTDLLTLFIILLLAFIVTHRRVPDLRPRYIVGNSSNWLTETDNVVVQDDSLKYIDTRWLWGLNDNLVKRGFRIPELTVNSLLEFLR